MTVHVTIQRPTPPFAASAANPEAQGFLAGLELRKAGADPEGKTSGYFLFQLEGSKKPDSLYNQTINALKECGIVFEERNGGEKLHLFVEGDNFIKLKSAIQASRPEQTTKAENTLGVTGPALKV